MKHTDIIFGLAVLVIGWCASLLMRNQPVDYSRVAPATMPAKSEPAEVANTAPDGKPDGAVSSNATFAPAEQTPVAHVIASVAYEQQPPAAPHANPPPVQSTGRMYQVPVYGRFGRFQRYQWVNQPRGQQGVTYGGRSCATGACGR